MSPAAPGSGSLRLRIVVIDPPVGVRFAMQCGRDELVPPTKSESGSLLFDFDLRIGKPLADGRPNFLGSFAQGTPSARFVYINSGTSAGQAGSCWTRRAKIMLAGIDQILLVRALRSDGRLEARMRGTGKDGGPTCASVQLLDGGWKLKE